MTFKKSVKIKLIIFIYHDKRKSEYMYFLKTYLGLCMLFVYT